MSNEWADQEHLLPQRWMVITPFPFRWSNTRKCATKRCRRSKERSRVRRWLHFLRSLPCTKKCVSLLPVLEQHSTTRDNYRRCKLDELFWQIGPHNFDAVVQKTSKMQFAQRRATRSLTRITRYILLCWWVLLIIHDAAEKRHHRWCSKVSKHFAFLFIISAKEVN